MRIRANLLGAALLAGLLVARLANAQPTPANMRSGTVAGSGGNQNVSFFTVPAGSSFVLTDLEWDPALNQPVNCQLVPGFSCLRLAVSLSGAPDRQSWWVTVFTAPDQSTQFQNIPFEKHWTTGIVYPAGSAVTFNIGDFNAVVQWRLSWSGYLVPGGVADVGTSTPEASALALRVGPNPAESDARIAFSLPAAGDVVLAVFDVQGRRIRTLYQGPLAEGNHSMPWDGRDDKGIAVASGVYFASLETAEAAEVQRLIHLK